MSNFLESRCGALKLPGTGHVAEVVPRFPQVLGDRGCQFENRGNEWKIETGANVAIQPAQVRRNFMLFVGAGECHPELLYPIGRWSSLPSCIPAYTLLKLSSGSSAAPW